MYTFSTLKRPSFFDRVKDVGGFLKEMLFFPVTLMREPDWSAKTAGALMAFVYAGVAGIAALTGYMIMDTAKNPTYSFEDQQDGARYDVTPTKKFVLQRLSGSFGRAADFETQTLCDAAFGTTTTMVPIYTTINNQSTLTGMIPVTSETISYANCTHFATARQTQQGAAQIEKMSGYLARGEAAYRK